MANKIALYSKTPVHPKLCFEGATNQCLKCVKVSKVYL